MNIVIFASGYFGEAVYNRLSGAIPFIIYTYSHDDVRSTGAKKFLRGGYPIRYISERAFDPSKIQLTADMKLFCIDWTKDFFHEAFHSGVLGCNIYHIHPTLLPKYRGYGAVSELFLNGVVASGVTVYRENGKIDCGDIVCQMPVKIELNDYPKEYLDKCAEMVSKYIISGNFVHEVRAQSSTEASYGRRYRERDGILDFGATATYVYNKIRAFAEPFFGAHFYHNGEKIKVLRGYCEKWAGEYGLPGDILKVDNNGAEIACGDGTIMLTDIEKDGRKYSFENLKEVFMI